MLGCVESWLSWGCDKIAKQVILRVLQTKYLKKNYWDKSRGVTSYNVSQDEKTKFCAKISEFGQYYKSSEKEFCFQNLQMRGVSFKYQLLEKT